jgi:hypothetical protein
MPVLVPVRLNVKLVVAVPDVGVATTVPAVGVPEHDEEEDTVQFTGI